MNDSEKKEFSAQLLGIGEVYGKAVSPQIAEIYWQTLKKYELSEVSNAFSQHLVNTDSGQFFPKPADLVKFIAGNSQSNALKAWSTLERAIRHVGPYQTVCFDDHIIHAVVRDMGGWIELNKISDDELPFKRNEFEKRYRGYLISPPDCHPKALCGISEADCNEKALPPPKPVIIGDKDKARLVYKKGSESSLPKITRVEEVARLKMGSK